MRDDGDEDGDDGRMKRKRRVDIWGGNMVEGEEDEKHDKYVARAEDYGDGEEGGGVGSEVERH